MGTVSGEQTDTTLKPKASEASGQPQVPDGMVLVKQEDHDRVHGDLRRTKGELRTLEEAELQRQRDTKQADAVAAGEYDKALGVEREEKEGLRGKLRKASLGDTLTDVIASKGYAGEQGLALKRLVDKDSVEFAADDSPVAATVDAAVNECIARYPNMFATQAKPDADDGEPKPRTERRSGPATPVSEQNLPEGYLTPKEYADTPWEVRHTEAFQKRATISEPFWPKHIRREDLQVDAS